jgi:hypothetical protein
MVALMLAGRMGEEVARAKSERRLTTEAQRHG